MQKQNKTDETLLSLLRTSNASDFVTNGEQYQIFPEGIMVCQINLPRNIEYGKREKFLFSIGKTFLSLNPELNFNLMYSYLSSINAIQAIISTPLTSTSITRVCNMIFDLRDKEGELTPVPNKLRKIIFNDKLNLSKKEKMQIINSEMGLLKKEKTKEIIYQAIESWDKPNKITIKGIVEIVEMSERTVKTYWSEFKEYVKELNQDIKEKQLQLKETKPQITNSEVSDIDVDITIGEETMPINALLKYLENYHFRDSYHLKVITRSIENGSTNTIKDIDDGLAIMKVVKIN